MGRKGFINIEINNSSGGIDSPPTIVNNENPLNLTNLSNIFWWVGNTSISGNKSLVINAPLAPEGLFGQSVLGDGLNKTFFLGNRGVDLKNRSFLFSFWFKGKRKNNTTDDVYFFGRNQNETEKNKALHIGYRHDDTFTVAFWSNDVDFSLPLEKIYSYNINKWVHFVVSHDTVTHKSKLFINGDYIGEGTHNGGQYQEDFSQLFGTRDLLYTKGMLSGIRLFVSEENKNFTFNNNDVKSLYKDERKYIIDINKG